MKKKAIYERFTLSLNVDTDADVLAYLHKEPNMIGAVRRALRAEMKAKADGQGG